MKKVIQIVILSGFCSFLDAGGFYGLIFADTNAGNISYHVMADAKRMESEMAGLAEEINYPFTPVVLKGDQLSEENIKETIGSLELQGDDIVFFYFTGHGQRNVDFQDDPWPLMTFHLDGGISLNFTDLTLELLEKQPRLVIALADCCNFELPEAPEKHIHFTHDPSNFDAVSIQSSEGLTPFGRLLIDTTGLIMLSASSPQEAAWSSPSGSLYSSAFIESLIEEKEESEPGFEEMFERILHNMAGYGQHPQYLMIPSGEEAFHTLQVIRYDKDVNTFVK